jgi:hypothetical protein
MVDLVTLVTACALSVEPKLMHALIWHQSGGEPWAVAVQNEPMPRVYSSMQEAISEARTGSTANGIVRVGLAVAVYRGSWQQPDVKFAEAVTATVAKGDAPNFDMPKDTDVEFLDTASETTPGLGDPFPSSVSAAEERERGWSSALFPSGPKPSASAPNDSPGDHPPAEKSPSLGVSNAHPSTVKSPADSLFVPRSSDRRPQ